MKQEDEIQLLKELAGIVGSQIELVRHDSTAGLEEMVGHSGQLARKIAVAGLLDRPQYDGWRERLAGLYGELQLMLSTQKDAVAGQLKLINKGKKTLAMYRDSNF
jgi:GAF domain-containing protein